MAVDEVSIASKQHSYRHLILRSREARHPNVVLYLGLSRAPDPDNRIFIISEYIENGSSSLYSCEHLS